METKQLTIDVELPIGTEFWIMVNNQPTMGVISYYDVKVTSATKYVEGNDSWALTLWRRFLSNTIKDKWEMSFTYWAHLIGTSVKGKVEKINGNWYFDFNEEYKKPRIYFSKEDLKKSVFNGDS